MRIFCKRRLAELPTGRRERHSICALWPIMMAALTSLCITGAARAQATHSGSTNPAQESASVVPLDPPPGGWLSSPDMTGDWGGLRTLLHRRGFDVRLSYVGEYAYNSSGGRRTGGDYAQQFTFGVDLDLGKVIGLTGGAFHMTFNAREGRSTSADFVGNKLAVQEVYGAGENFRLSEFSYDQYLAGKLLNVKLGFYPMGNDFASTPILCDFQNVGFCAHPQSLPNNSGWSDSPTAKWGSRLRVNLPDGFATEIGVFDVNPTYSNHNNGLKISFQGSTGAIIPIELEKTVKLGPAQMPGHYKVGGYYDTSRVADAADVGVMRTGRYGAYLLADQMIWSFEPRTDRGLTLVADVTVSDRATAQIPTYFLGALVAHGPFAARPHDFIALGYVRAMVNKRTIDVQQARMIASGITNPSLELGEYVVELSYGFQATPWMLIHPNLQYIGNPGAFSFQHTPDAWVVGLATKIVF